MFSQLTEAFLRCSPPLFPKNLTYQKSRSPLSFKCSMFFTYMFRVFSWLKSQWKYMLNIIFPENIAGEALWLWDWNHPEHHLRYFCHFWSRVGNLFRAAACVFQGRQHRWKAELLSFTLWTACSAIPLVSERFRGWLATKKFQRVICMNDSFVLRRVTSGSNKNTDPAPRLCDDVANEIRSPPWELHHPPS